MSHQGYAPVISTSYPCLDLIKVTSFWMSSRRGGRVSWKGRRGLEKQAQKIAPLISHASKRTKYVVNIKKVDHILRMGCLCSHASFAH